MTRVDINDNNQSSNRGSVGECIVLDMSTYVDRLAKSHAIKSRVSSRDTSSSRGLEDEV
jgi:hypothetical protein